MTELQTWLTMVACAPRQLIIFWTGVAIVLAYILGRLR